MRFVWIETKDQIQEEIEHEHNRPFQLKDTTKPLWRLVVILNKLQQEKVGFLICQHHVTADGMTKLAVQSAFYQLLNNFSINSN